jgi:hypothetical protein
MTSTRKLYLTDQVPGWNLVMHQYASMMIDNPLEEIDQYPCGFRKSLPGFKNAIDSLTSKDGTTIESLSEPTR